MNAETTAAECTIRPMTLDDLGAAHELSLNLKWPHRMDDWAMMLRLSRGFVAEHSGKVIGTAFACPQGAYVSIGLVIVSDQYQGLGLGRRLMDSVLAIAEPATPVLTATVAGTPLYQKLGFVVYAAIHQHQGVPGPVAQVGRLAPGEKLRKLTGDDQFELMALTSAACGMDRTWPISEVFAVAQQGAVIERDGRACAFAALRPFGRGLSIGPVIAENAEQAKRLISTLLASVPDAFVRLDVTASSDLSAWLSSLNLAQVDTVQQMARGEAPVSAVEARQFALVTQAIG